MAPPGGAQEQGARNRDQLLREAIEKRVVALRKAHPAAWDRGGAAKRGARCVRPSAPTTALCHALDVLWQPAGCLARGGGALGRVCVAGRAWHAGSAPEATRFPGLASTPWRRVGSISGLWRRTVTVIGPCDRSTALSSPCLDEGESGRAARVGCQDDDAALPQGSRLWLWNRCGWKLGPVSGLSSDAFASVVERYPSLISSCLAVFPLTKEAFSFILPPLRSLLWRPSGTG